MPEIGTLFNGEKFTFDDLDQRVWTKISEHSIGRSCYVIGVVILRRINPV